MRIEALMLGCLLALGGIATAAPQEGPQEGGAAGTSQSPETMVGPADPKVDVAKLIADYNATLDAPRTFTAEEKSWIATGDLDQSEVDAVYKGYAQIPTGDPNVVRFMKDGKSFAIVSDEDLATRPAGQETPPYAEEIAEGTFWMPVAASETAKSVDAMFNFIMWTNYIFAAIIGVLMVVFCIKYRRKPGVRADQSITHNTPIEIIWSVLPTILCGVMFWGGYTTFLDMRTPPPDSFQVNVGARQWGWDFTYSNGVQSQGEIHVPANTPVELVMNSADVIHSFHLPAFRQKSDILPNRYTKIWFESGEPAVYRVYCSEFCGKLHSDMYARLVVEPKADFDAWLVKTGNWMVNEDGSPKPPLEIGKLTYTKKGCAACHSIDGKAGTAPTFAGLWGLDRKLVDKDKGEITVKADENYISNSIRNPHDQLVEGYGKQMTIYNPMLKQEQIDGVIAFIKSLKDVPRVD